MTLRCVKWQEKDDPWKEQKKYIGYGPLGDHPLGIHRDFVPPTWRANDYEIIRKPTVIFK